MAAAGGVHGGFLHHIHRGRRWILIRQIQHQNATKGKYMLGYTKIKYYRNLHVSVLIIKKIYLGIFLNFEMLHIETRKQFHIEIKYAKKLGIIRYKSSLPYGFNFEALYYVVNLIMPCLMLTLVMLFGQYLPCNSGDSKVQLGTALFTSMCVFLLLVGTMMPPSDVQPLLGNEYSLLLNELPRRKIP